jgi:long-chain-fatty-acid--[acyl-carrier-protein] ligase
MIAFLLRTFVKAALWLRYRVRVRGVREIARRGRSSILFLPNHPGLIDPVILTAYLHGPFRVRPLADKDQIDRFFVRTLTRQVRALPIPDLRAHGPAARAEVETALGECIAALRQGDNILLYPAGHIYRSRFEDVRGNSAVERIVREVPEARVVLVRTRGLWGSRFTLAHGHFPHVATVLRQAAWTVLANFLFFAPRRNVTVELHEPSDFPRQAARSELNSYLERFYNADAPGAWYVPYTLWERGGPRPLPEPETSRLSGDTDRVPPATRALVTDYLRELAGVAAIRDADRLAEELGLDSLSKAELVLWLHKEFGFAEGDVDALQTVGDVLLAARGQALVVRPVELKPVPRRWLHTRSTARIALPPGNTILEVFLAQARRNTRRALLADQVGGVRTYRDLLTGINALRPYLEQLPGDHLAIMLPASVAASVAYLTALFAGKTPVMLNWTVGPRTLAHTLDLTRADRVLTSRVLATRLAAQGVDLQAISDRFVYLEDLRRGISRGQLLRARLSRPAAPPAKPGDTAVVLITSGSESLPKAVPLTHANLLANLRDVTEVITVREDDCLIGFLPPFHSFGLTVTLLLPLLAGVRAVYHANPTEAWLIGRLVDLYGATMICGTPTFLSGIARAGSREQLRTLRLAVTGAEKCPDNVYQLLAERCPGAVVLEGYGITECSPIVAVNRAENPRPGTIGQVLPSLAHTIVDPDTGRPVLPGATGLLLVRGPSIFGGYLGGDAASPFVEHDGQTWYRTGDLVSADAAGVLTFRGRLKRFIKLGGEMVSLPAIEAALEPRLAREGDEGPVLAVEATPSEDHPEVVLFAVRDIDRATANRHLREAGLSPLHNISRVIRVDQIPLLGTGKTDYRALRARLAEPPP